MQRGDLVEQRPCRTTAQQIVAETKPGQSWFMDVIKEVLGKGDFYQGYSYCSPVQKQAKIQVLRGAGDILFFNLFNFISSFFVTKGRKIEHFSPEL